MKLNNESVFKPTKHFNVTSTHLSPLEYPVQIFPDIYNDDRGWFQDVFRGDLLTNCVLPKIKQINRSSSHSYVIRGCHAQAGLFCQMKIVEALNYPIFDIITDCRPDSEHFGKTDIFCLNPERQNKLYVPHGFLHAFIVPEIRSTYNQALFNYYCDNPYNKESEICINPKTILPDFLKKMIDEAKNKCENLKIDCYQTEEEQKNLNYKQLFYNVAQRTVMDSDVFGIPQVIYSDKDCNGINFEDFKKQVMTEYKSTGKLWYKWFEGNVTERKIN